MRSSPRHRARVERAGRRGLEALAGERLAVDDTPAVARLRVAQELPHGRHPRFGGALRAPDPRQLGGALHPTAVVEEPLIDVERDPCAAQPVGVRNREARGHDRVLETDVLHETETDLGKDRVQVEALRDELLGPIRLERLQLHVGCRPLDVVELERVDAHEPAPADLRVRERVADGDRDLVAQLERALAVADDQRVGHSAAG